MDNLGDKLRFTRQECGPLCTILSQYRRANHAAIPEEVNRRLEVAHHIASVVRMGDLFGPGAMYRLYESTGNEPPNAPTPAPEAQEILIDNEGDAIGAAIKWAADAMVMGSVIMQNQIGEILNSDYEDMGMPQAVGSSAHRRGLQHIGALHCRPC